MPHFEANGFYLDDTRVENFIDIKTPYSLKDLTKMLNNVSPDAVFTAKNALKGLLIGLINKLDNFSKDETYDIIKKISVILTNIDNMLKVDETKVKLTTKLIKDLSTDIVTIFAKETKSESETED